MIITDTHTHLYSEAFNEDRHEVVKRAIAAGVSRFFIPAIDSQYTDAMLQLEKDFSGHIFLMTGLHPTHVKDNYKEELKHVEDLLAVRSFYAGDDLFGVFHCFTGTLEQAEKAISYDLKLGIGGVATFKNGKIDTFLSKIDLKHIVLETDAPYLAPTPYRGKRNESAYIVNVLDKLATLYQKTEEEVAEITTNNSKAIFKI